MDTMNKAELDKVMEKIQKLMALGQSPNENEAATALGMAHELLQKYNLSLDDFQIKNSEMVEEVFQQGGTIRDYEFSLLGAIAYANYCGVYKNKDFQGFGPTGRRIRQSKLNLVGKEHNVIACKIMATYIFDALEKSAKKMKGKGKEVVASYKVGFASVVANRVKELRKQDLQTSTCTDLVVTSDADLKKFYEEKKISTIKIKMKATNVNGLLQGQMDGMNLSLNSQIKAQSTARNALIA